MYIELRKDKLHTFKKKKKHRVAAAAFNILLDKKCRETPGRVTGSSELLMIIGTVYIYTISLGDYTEE